MQKVGINELRKMILEEMGLEEQAKTDTDKRVAKKKQKNLQKSVLSKVFKEFSSQLKITPERRAEIALGLLSKSVSESQDYTEEELKFVKDLEPFINDALKAGNNREEIEKIINDALQKIRSNKGSSDSADEKEEELPKEFKPYFNAFVKFNKEIEDPNNTTKEQLEAAASKISTTVDALVEYYEGVIEKLGAEQRKYPNFMKELNNFGTAYKTANKQEPEETENEQDAKAQKILKSFTEFIKAYDEALKKKQTQNTPKEPQQSSDSNQANPIQEAENKESSAKLTKVEVEELAKKVGLNFDNLKEIAKKMYESDSVMNNASDEVKKQLIGTLNRFDEIVKSTATAEDIYKAITERYQKSVKEKLETLEPESEEYKKFKESAENVQQAFKRAFLKDEAPEEEVVEKIETAVQEADGPKNFDDEYKMVEDLINFVIGQVFGSDEESQQSKTLPQDQTVDDGTDNVTDQTVDDGTDNVTDQTTNIDTEEQGDEVRRDISNFFGAGPSQLGENKKTKVIGGSLAAGATGGFLASIYASPALALFGLGATAPVAAGGAAFMAITTTSALILNKILKKDADNFEYIIPKSIRDGIRPFIKRMVKLAGENTDIINDIHKEVRQQFGPIIDEDDRLKLRFMDESKIPKLVKRLIADLKDKVDDAVGDADEGPIDGSLELNDGDTEEENPLHFVLKRFADLISFQQVQEQAERVNKTREEDIKSMLRFLTTLRKDRDSKYFINLIKQKFKSEERSALIWYFSDKKRAIDWAKKYFPADIKRIKKANKRYVPSKDKATDNVKLEEALIPIVDKMIVEIYQELKEKT